MYTSPFLQKDDFPEIKEENKGKFTAWVKKNMPGKSTCAAASAVMKNKDKYKPAYQFVSSHNGNHTFRITAARDNAFEYLLSSAWSEGAVYNNEKDFSDYIRKTKLEYESPVQASIVQIQDKSN